MTLGNTFCNVDAEALDNTLTDRLAKVKAETLGYLIGDAMGKKLLYPLAITRVQVEGKRPANKLGGVEAKPLLVALGDALAVVEV